MSSRSSSLRLYSYLLLPGDALEASHVRTQSIRNDDRAVGLLVVFKDGEPCASDSQAAPVECVNKLRLALAPRLEPNIRSPSLKSLKVRTRRNLPIELLSRKPNFKVEGLRGRESRVAGAEQNAPVGKIQRFQNLLGIACQSLVFGVRLVRARKLYQLHFLKLVLANNPTCILACCACLGAEARCISCEADRQPGLVQNLVTIEIGDRHLSRRD